MLLDRTEGNVYKLFCWAELMESFLECVGGQI